MIKVQIAHQSTLGVMVMIIGRRKYKSVRPHSQRNIYERN
jgi:hypothetical protein